MYSFSTIRFFIVHINSFIKTLRIINSRNKKKNENSLASIF